MKVRHISTFDVHGGAARAAHRLHVGLCALGIESKMQVAQRESRDPSIQQLPGPTSRMEVWRKRLRGWRLARSLSHFEKTRPAGTEYFSLPWAEHRRDWASSLANVDIVHLHWVATLLDYPDFFAALPAHLPLVWTLHDMNPITGGCHYAAGCERFEQQCGLCPQLGSTREDDPSRQTWEAKREAYRRRIQTRTVVVAPSRWLADQARHSSLFRALRIETVPYGLATDVFAPKDRAAARGVLGLPVEAKVLLFVSDDLENHRKGGDLLCATLARLEARSNSDIVCLTLGRGSLNLSASIRQMPLGVCGSDPLLAVVYSAADVFILPSREDNLPNTVLEAMACGTPSVGFRVGGVSDMVVEGETGWLAPPYDTEALAQAVAKVIDQRDGGKAMRAACRDRAVRQYSLHRQAEDYCRLYDELLR